MNAVGVLCAQLTRDLFAISKFLFALRTLLEQSPDDSTGYTYRQAIMVLAVMSSPTGLYIWLLDTGWVTWLENPVSDIAIHPSMFISQKSQIRHMQHTLVQSKSKWCNKTQ